MFKFFLFVIGVTLFLGGCVVQTRVPMTNTILLEGTDSRFQIIDEAIGRDSSGLLKVEVDLMNISNFRGRVAYKVIWKDANGFTIDTIMSRWIYADIEPNRELHIRAIAPTPKATYHKIRVVEPKFSDEVNSYQYHKSLGD